MLVFPVLCEYRRAVLLKLEKASESPEELVKTQFLSAHPRWGLRLSFLANFIVMLGQDPPI